MSLLLLFNQPAAAPAVSDEAQRASLWRQWQLQQQMQLVQPTRNDEAPGAVIELVAWVRVAGEASGSSLSPAARAPTAHYQFVAGEATPEWPTPPAMLGIIAECRMSVLPTGDAWLPTTRVMLRAEMAPGPARVHTATAGAAMALHCEMKTWLSD